MDRDHAYIVTQLKRGDGNAFRAVYDRYHQRVYSFSLRFTHCPDDAQEMVQETFVKLWQHRAKINPQRPLAPYLYRIAKNENLKFLQRAARHQTLRELLHQRMSFFTPTVEDDFILAEYTSVARQAISLLPPKRKLVYEMAQQEGKSTQEIAVSMGITPQTVSDHLTQALRFIRHYLKQHADLSLGLLVALLARLF